MLCGIIVIPILHLAYTAAVWRMWDFKEAVLYFFFMPFVSATSIVASESFSQVAASVGPLYLLIAKRDTGNELRATRKVLQADVRDIAKRLGWAEVIKKCNSSHTSLSGL